MGHIYDESAGFRQKSNDYNLGKTPMSIWDVTVKVFIGQTMFPQ